MQICVRPATTDDVTAFADDFPALIEDRWRPGGNRRSFVAVLPTDAESTAGLSPLAADTPPQMRAGVATPPTARSERVVGHCRAVDSSIHPDSRVMLLEVAPDLEGQGVDDELLRAQINVSTAAPHMKIYEHQIAEQQLAVRFGGIAVQVTPPWRYRVGPELRAWASGHAADDQAAIGPPRSEDADDLLTLEVDHYIAQHSSWSPTAPRESLLVEFGQDHDPQAAGTWDRGRSRVLRRDGRIAAAVIVWPAGEDEPVPATGTAELAGIGAGDGAPEVSLLSRPYVGRTSRADKEACLAALIDASADGDVLLVDSHLTMREEWAMMREVPGSDPSDGTGWMAITAIPVPGGPAPLPVPRELVPEETPWVHALLP